MKSLHRHGEPRLAEVCGLYVHNLNPDHIIRVVGKADYVTFHDLVSHENNTDCIKAFGADAGFFDRYSHPISGDCSSMVFYLLSVGEQDHSAYIVHSFGLRSCIIDGGVQKSFINNIFRCVWKPIRQEKQIKSNSNRNCRSRADVFDCNSNSDSQSAHMKLSSPNNMDAFNLDPRALAGNHLLAGELVGVSSNFEGSVGLTQSTKNKENANKAEHRLRPCGLLLPLSSDGTAFGGHGSTLLGVQIIGLTLVGFGFAFLGAEGICRVFDYPEWNRKLSGWVLAVICLPAAFFFVGWATTGHPLAFWGLCGAFSG